MPTDPATQLDTLIERIETSEAIDDADREHLLAFDRRLSLLAQEYSTYRHLKLLRHLTIIAESCPGGQLAAALDDRDACEAIVAWINSEYENAETNRDYRSALRVFAKRVTDGDDPPETVDWVPTGTSSDYDPTPDPRQMLRWEDDVKPMLSEANYARNAAMIALQFDAGLRGGEFKELDVGDIQNHRHGLQVTVDGKQGQRSVLLIPSVPYVSRWLEDHPGGDDRNAPLWSKLNRPEEITDRMLYDVFEQCAERAGVDRPVTLTNFRKSSAAFLASRNLSQAHIEDHHGWVRGSDAAARYIAVFGEATERELARLHGKDVSDEEPEDIAPIECPTCERENAHDASLCDRCGQALDQQAAAQLDDLSDSVNQTLAQLDPEQAATIIETADLLRSQGIEPELLGED
jgi:integrase